MLKLKCQRCQTVLLEAEARWERVARTGMCPDCSWFYDEAREVEVERVASDPEVLRDARQVKLYEIVLGGSATAVALLGLFIWIASYLKGGVPLPLLLILGLAGLLAFGVRTLLHGLAYDNRREARSKLARRSDLRALAQRQAAAGVFERE
jgi:hypothetical protein